MKDKEEHRSVRDNKTENKKSLKIVLIFFYACRKRHPSKMRLDEGLI